MAAAPVSRPVRAHYTLVVLTLIYLCSNIDRSLMAVLLEPIRHEFGLSDTQLGLLSGLAFAVVFGTAGIPLGILADRTSRRKLIAAALVVWAGASALCGVAQNFVQLLLFRVGVGAGEAAGSPAAMSMVSDLYPAHQRGTAMAFYYLATAIGAAAAFAAGGWLSDHYGWRAAFILLSVPGLLLAFVVWLTVREPARGAGDGQAASPSPPLREVVRFITSQRALLLIFGALTINSFVASGMSAWITSFLVRAHGMTLEAAGPLIGSVYGVLGMAGTFLGGVLSDLLARRDERARAWLLGGSTLLSVPAVLLLVQATTIPMAATGLAGFAFLTAVPFGAGYAVCQSLVRPAMRATSAAIMYLLTNLVGYGLGPPGIGLGSDWLGAGGLGSAMFAAGSINLLSALFYVMAARSIRADFRTAAAPQP